MSASLEAEDVGAAAPAASGDRGERVLLSRAFARLDPIALSFAVGVVSGLGLTLVTAALVIKGGHAVGLHLSRLAFYLPGYDVSWPGALFGFVDAGLLGCALGLALAWLWNGYHRIFVALVVARERSRDARVELQGL